MAIQNDGLIQRDPLIGANIGSNVITNAMIQSQTSTKIVGLPTQTSDFNIGGKNLVNSYIIRPQTNDSIYLDTGAPGVATTGVINVRSQKSDTGMSTLLTFQNGDSPAHIDLSNAVLDMNGCDLKDLINSTNTTVSGTAKTVKILIGATPYYFLIYPTSSA